MTSPFLTPTSRETVRSLNTALDKPSHAGVWFWRATPLSYMDQVTVEETHAAGRFCRDLRMGGSAQCPGYRDWAGLWYPELPKFPQV